MLFDNQGIEIYDISFYQVLRYDNYGKPLPPDQWKYPDFNLMKTAGNASAVVIRCGQYTYKDSAFDKNWQLAKEASLPRASYWFCDGRDTGKNQAQRYWSYIKNDVGEGFLCADYEETSWTDWNQLYNFIVELQQLSGLPNDKIWIYSSYYYYTAHSPYTLEQKNWFSKYPLWLASYPSDPLNYKNVLVPATWVAPVLWQNGTYPIGRKVGVWTEEIDHNFLNGGMTTLSKYFNGVTTPPVIGSFPKEIYIKDKLYKEG